MTLSSQPFLRLQASKNVLVRLTCMNGLSSIVVGGILDSAKATIGISSVSMYPTIQWSQPGNASLEISMTNGLTLDLFVSGLNGTGNQYDIQYLFAVTIQDI